MYSALEILLVLWQWKKFPRAKQHQHEFFLMYGLLFKEQNKKIKKNLFSLHFSIQPNRLEGILNSVGDLRRFLSTLDWLR